MKTRNSPSTFIHVLTLILLMLSIHPSLSFATLLYDYSYIGNAGGAFGPPYNNSNFLTIDIQSPTALGFSNLDHFTGSNPGTNLIGTDGLTLTLFDQVQTLQSTDLNIVNAELYFLLPEINSLLPVTWVINLSTDFGSFLGSYNPTLVSNSSYEWWPIDSSGLSGHYWQTVCTGTWTLNITDNGTPVPEPSALYLLGVGMVGLVGFMKRKMQSA